MEENPEYLEKYQKMISPVAKDEDDYKLHKDQIDNNFSINWNAKKH